MKKKLKQDLDAISEHSYESEVPDDIEIDDADFDDDLTKNIDIMPAKND